MNRIHRLAFLALATSLHAAEPTVAFRIQLDTVSRGYDGKTCWVHPRAGTIPGPVPSVVLTMPKLLLTGSDVLFVLHEMRTDDLGRTWRGPTEHADTLGRRDEPNGVIVASCDFGPNWHAPEVWIAEHPDHLNYFDDERFLGPYPDVLGAS